MMILARNTAALDFVVFLLVVNCRQKALVCIDQYPSSMKVSKFAAHS